MQISRRVIGNNPTALVICTCGTAHTFKLGEPVQLLYFLCDCGEPLAWVRYPQTLAQLLEDATQSESNKVSNDNVF